MTPGLTIAALNPANGDPWELAITAPLPPNAGLELLWEVRRLVVEHLDMCTLHRPSAKGEKPEILHDEIRRASARLIEVCDAMRTAWQARDAAPEMAS